MTDLKALAERLESHAVDLHDDWNIAMPKPQTIAMSEDLRQAAQALRVLIRIGKMTVYHEGGNAMTLGDAPSIARSALKERDGLE